MINKLRQSNDQAESQITPVINFSVKDLLLTVIIPAFNEEASIGLVIQGLKALELPIQQILVIDNASVDQTKEVSEREGAEVLFESKRGYGAACLKGLNYIESQSVTGSNLLEIVAIIDADYSDYPEELPKLLEPIVAGKADFVIGSRVILEHSRQSVPFPARFGNWLVTRMLFVRYGVRLSDLGPFRAIRKEVLSGFKMEDLTWGWNVEMQFKAAAQGIRVEEVPVRYRPRFAGTSKISHSLIGGTRAALKILWVLSLYLLKSFLPKRFMIS